MRNAAGIIIGIGSIVFAGAALNPVVAEAMGNPMMSQGLIDRIGVGWPMAMTLMNVGTLATTVGVLLVAVSARNTTIIGFVAAATAAAASFAWFSLSRLGFAPPSAPNVSAIPPSVQLYTILLSSTILLLGWTLFRARPRWLGLTLLASGGVALAAGVVWELPVLTTHLPLLFLGGTLELASSPPTRNHTGNV